MNAQAAARVRCKPSVPLHQAAFQHGPTHQAPRPLFFQERFARKNEAEDLRRAFDVLDTKKCARGGGPRAAGDLVKAHTC